MTRSEWFKIVAVLQARWPNQQIATESAEVWFEDLNEFPAEQVSAAASALYRDGREFAPNGAQIRSKLIELTADNDGWSLAYGLAVEAATRHGGAEYGGLTWLTEQDPLAASAAQVYGWRDFCLSDAPDTTRRAQFRDIYNEIKGAVERKARYQGIPPAGLKALEGRPTTIGEAVRQLVERSAA